MFEDILGGIEKKEEEYTGNIQKGDAVVVYTKMGLKGNIVQVHVKAYLVENVYPDGKIEILVGDPQAKVIVPVWAIRKYGRNDKIYTNPDFDVGKIAMEDMPEELVEDAENG